MTIIEFVGTNNIGGGETYSLRLSEWLRTRGHRVIYVVNEDSLMRAEVEKRGFETHSWPLFRGRRKRKLYALLRMCLLLRRQRVDVVHTQMSFANTVGGWTGKFCRVPVVAHAQSMDSAKAYHHSTYIVAVAKAVRHHLMQQQIDGARIHVVYNGVSLEGLEPITFAERLAARERWNLDSETPVIAVLANLRVRKGHRFLLEAMALLQQEDSGRASRIVALFAGEGEELASLQELADKLGLSHRVRFLGFCDNVPEVLAASDAFVLPSSKEGLSIAVTEAMAREIPVVTTDVGGLPEVVREGETG